MSSVAEVLGRNQVRPDTKSFPWTKINPDYKALTHRGQGETLHFGGPSWRAPFLFFMPGAIPHRMPRLWGHEHHTAPISSCSWRLSSAKAHEEPFFSRAQAPLSTFYSGPFPKFCTKLHSFHSSEIYSSKELYFLKVSSRN